MELLIDAGARDQQVGTEKDRGFILRVALHSNLPEVLARKNNA